MLIIQEKPEKQLKPIHFKLFFKKVILSLLKIAYYKRKCFLIDLLLKLNYSRKMYAFCSSTCKNMLNTLLLLCSTYSQMPTFAYQYVSVIKRVVFNDLKFYIQEVNRHLAISVSSFDNCVKKLMTVKLL